MGNSVTGGTKVPFSHSGRLLVSFWWIYVTVIVTTYSGNLVAFLTFPQIENAVQTLDNLIENKDRMTWGYVGDSALADYFKVKLTTEERLLYILCNFKAVSA